ncbi:MAG: hypothetical protein AB2L07_08010 [Thermoanaerobaculaceae bacterium]
MGTEAALNTPEGLAIDRNGDLLIANNCKQVVRRLDRQTGRLSTVIGEMPKLRVSRYEPPHSILGGGAQLLVVDPSGNLFFSVTGAWRITRYDAATQTVSVFAGKGSADVFGGDGGPAIDAFLEVKGLATDADGNVLLAGANRIRRIDSHTGIIETIAGTGRFGFFGDGGPARSADLANPTALAYGLDGTLYFADAGNNRIRAISPRGTIRTVAGNGLGGPPQDGEALREAVGEVLALATEPGGDVLFMDFRKSLRRLDVRRGQISTMTERGDFDFEKVRKVPGLAVDRQGTIYFDVPGDNVVKAIRATAASREPRQ